MHRIVVPIRALGLVLGLVAPITVYAETISVPSADPPSSAAALPPPTVLRGSPPSTASAVPICPPGYTLSPDFGSGCVGPSGGGYSEGSTGYDYWPDYGFGYPFGGFGHGGGRFHHFAKSRGFSNVHRSAHFRGPARFGGFGTGTGHMAGFGRR